VKLIWALIRRDLMLAARQGGGAGTAIGFFVTVMVLLPLGIVPDQALLQRIAPGALWIALLLSVLLSAERIFQSGWAPRAWLATALAFVCIHLAWGAGFLHGLFIFADRWRNGDTMPPRLEHRERAAATTAAVTAGVPGGTEAVGRTP